MFNIVLEFSDNTVEEFDTSILHIKGRRHSSTGARPDYITVTKLDSSPLPPYFIEGVIDLRYVLSAGTTDNGRIRYKPVSFNAEVTKLLEEDN